MDRKKIPIITINREYGAGGNTLAGILSERLGIPYYDKEFVMKTVESSELDEEDVERESEELSRSSQIVDSLFGGTVPYSSSHDRIFEVQKKVIKELAKSPCIMVGRCANHILKEAGMDIVSIYLHAPFENRVDRVKELEACGEMSPDKFTQHHDEMRRNYYRKYTGAELFDASAYTLCLDTGQISMSVCADIVLKLLEQD